MMQVLTMPIWRFGYGEWPELHIETIEARNRVEAERWFHAQHPDVTPTLLSVQEPDR